VRISTVDLNGNRQKCEDFDKAVGFKSEITEIDAIVKHIAGFVVHNNISKAKPIWTPKLKDTIPLEELLDNKTGFNGQTWISDDYYLAPVIGLIDDPQSQSQYPLRLNIGEDGHVAVYGSPGTGKTTLLQTLVMSLARSYSPDDVNIYIMDFGGWSMNIFKDIPHIGGIVNDNEEEKIEKLIRLLSKELDDRKHIFAGVGVQNIMAYRQSTGENLAAIVLILDNFVPVYGMYPDLEPFFLSLTQQGGSYGMYFVVSTGNTMSLGFKMTQNIKMAIALQMVDKSDYSAIVGKTNGLEPGRADGRGLIKCAIPLEFQTALPVDALSDSARVGEIKKICSLMSDKWKGKRAKPIPIMPEVIVYNSLSEDKLKIPIGLGMIDVDPIFIDLNDSHFFIISGVTGSGKSNLLKAIAKRFMNLDNANLTIYDSEQLGLSEIKEVADNYITDATFFDKYIESLQPILKERLEQYKSDSSTRFSPFAIVIDDIKHCFDNACELTVNRLEAILRLGSGLNVNIFVAGQHGDIIKLHSQMEKFTFKLVNDGIGILLGGKFNTHGVFESKLNYTEKEVDVGDYEGFILRRGNAKRFKAIFAK
jgi:S-DNA-T family DNA segregation ATPase FtsK/SpoIIIE